MNNNAKHAHNITLTAGALAAVRGYRRLFSDVSFNAAPGSVVSLRGANGAGKSTLLRILAGLTRAEAGSVDWSADGRPLEDASCRLHYVGHLDGVKPQESAQRQARFWARFFNAPPESADNALAAMGLSSRADVPGRGLSAGQRRRLALSRLLIAPRPVWLLDEPLSSLDADGRRLVSDLVAGHAAAGGIVVAAVHGDGLAASRTLDLSEYCPRAEAAA